MIQVIKNLKFTTLNSKFVRDIALLAGSTAIGQVLVIAVSPILTRIYSPENFGILAIYTSVLSTLVIVGSMRYELAIPLAKDDNSVFALTLLSLIILIIFGSLVTVITFIWGSAIYSAFHFGILKSYEYYIPLGILGAGTYQTFNNWAIRYREFNQIARTRLYQSTAQVTSQLGLGILDWGVVALIVGQLLSMATGTTSLARLAWKTHKRTFKVVSFREIKDSALRFKRFPLMSSWSGFLNTASLQLPTMLLAFFYGTEVVGWFSLAQRVIATPMALVGSSVSQVYFGTASNLLVLDKHAFKKLFFVTIKKLLIFGAIPFGVIALVSPWLFTVTFGHKWHMAGVYVQLLCAMYMAQFAVSPLSQTLNILERQDLQLYWDISRLLIVLGSILLARYLHWSSLAAVAMYGGGMLFSYLTLFALYIFAIRTEHGGLGF